MKILMITGDRSFGPGHPRYELQKATVEKLDVVYWGRGNLWPMVPDEHYDVVTSQDPFWRGLFAWSVAKSIGTQLNVQVHTDLDSISFVKHVLAQIPLRVADSIRVVSEKIKEQVEHFGVHAPITVLPVFVDLARFENVSHVEHAQKIILWLGRFEPEKDPLCAIEVFKKVREAGVDVKLIMLGTGSLEQELEAAAVALPSLTRVDVQEGNATAAALVEFPGWQDPVPFLTQADVVLCTSLHESWGASIVEALAARVAVVAPDVGVAREAGAIVVDRSKLADAVIDVLRNEKRGELKLSLPTAQVWAVRWRESVTAGRVGA